MKRKHYVFNEKVFKLCKYLKTFEREQNIDDLKKYDEKQYYFMCDTLDYFVDIYNVLNVDANYGISDRIEKLINVMASYLFDKRIYDDENDEDTKKRYRYSVRYVDDNVFEELTKQIYKKTIKWYKVLNQPIKVNDLIKTEEYQEMVSYINTTMKRLERVGFDKVYNVNVNYEKNKNYEYKIYLNRLGSLSDEKKKYQIEYIKDFNDNNVDKIDINIVDECIEYLFDFVSYGINGLSMKLYGNKQVIYDYSKKDKCPFDYYLELIGIELNSEIYLKNRDKFNTLFFDIYDFYDLSNRKTLIKNYGCSNDEEFLSNDLFNSNPNEAFKRRKYLFDNYDYSRLTDFLNEYDLYRFRYCIDYLYDIYNCYDVDDKNENIYIKSVNLLCNIKEINNSTLNKIINDLFEIRKYIQEDNLKEAYKLLNNIVNRNIRFFKRVS